MKYLSLIFLLTLTACSHQRQSLRFGDRNLRVPAGERAALPPLEAPIETKEEKTPDPSDVGQRIAEAAKSVVGQTQVKAEGKYFRRDCSGTARGIYQLAGLDLGFEPSIARENDSKSLYRLMEKNGEIANEPKVGDIVFFDNTYDVNRDGKENDPLSHVGVVESILEDGTILFVHYMGRSIIRSRMNLAFPAKQLHPETGERINHMLRRRGSKHKGSTAAQLFAGFGRLKEMGSS